MLEIKNLNITIQILKKYILVKYLVLIILIPIENCMPVTEKKLSILLHMAWQLITFIFFLVKLMPRKKKLKIVFNKMQSAIIWY